MSPALAKITAEQAAQLGGSTLTAFGAEKAGNADGSIPAYTGGLRSVPPGITVRPDTFLPDPYAADKKLYSVDSKNADQYAAQLTPGTLALIKKYPGFRIDVYPTHRSSAYPQWVLDNIKKNATTAQLIGSVEGDGVTGAYGGIPFPIPQNGYELLWNSELKWQGVYVVDYHGMEYFVDASGHRTLDNETEVDNAVNFYDRTRTSLPDAFQQRSIERITAPAAQDGSLDLIEYPLDYSNADSTIYTYTVGQRRVRLAPEFKYDTPVAQSGGSFTYDEIDLYQGRADRFDYKLVGKKEMLVPYNCFKINQPSTTEDALFIPQFMNPDYVRWEKHRVWVLDATLKPGKRHVNSRRTYYIDEDSWAIVASESYDQGSRLYRIGYDLSYPIYNAPDSFIFPTSFVIYNLNSSSYNFTNYFGGQAHGYIQAFDKIPSASFFNPETLAGSGIR